MAAAYYHETHHVGSTTIALEASHRKLSIGSAALAAQHGLRISGTESVEPR